jgi:hypothetical protein
MDEEDREHSKEIQDFCEAYPGFVDEGASAENAEVADGNRSNEPENSAPMGLVQLAVYMANHDLEEDTDFADALGQAMIETTSAGLAAGAEPPGMVIWTATGFNFQLGYGALAGDGAYVQEGISLVFFSGGGQNAMALYRTSVTDAAGLTLGASATATVSFGMKLFPPGIDVGSVQEGTTRELVVNDYQGAFAEAGLSLAAGSAGIAGGTFDSPTDRSGQAWQGVQGGLSFGGRFSIIAVENWYELEGWTR